MGDNILRLLQKFCDDHKVKSKGKLSTVLQVTDMVSQIDFPVDADELVAESGTQVKGVSGSYTQKILAQHNIEKKLSSEGGRTSRGSVPVMRAYIKLLNEIHSNGQLNLEAVMDFWIGEARKFFAGKPLRVKVSPTAGLRQLVRSVMEQAHERQSANPHVTYAGTVLQHLVGAKLECALGGNSIEHNSASRSDEQSSRPGDFLVGDVAIHVTTSPGQQVIDRCKENIEHNNRPILVTGSNQIGFIHKFIENQNLESRIDVFDAEQFIALNIYELGKFEQKGREEAVAEIVDRYNQIVETVETDPSLRIELLATQQR